MRTFTVIIAGALLMGGIGCAGRPTLVPNYDPALRKTSAEFAADGAKRQPFKADLPHGGEALGRASVDYTFKKIEVINYSDDDWENIEFWVNEKYVVFVPKIVKNNARTEELYFQMFYDGTGNYFWTENGKTRVEKLEMVRDGKVYNIKLSLAD